MLDSDEWKTRVVDHSQTLCPACESTRVTMGACAIGSVTVHQEYVCEDCQHEFTALFALAGCYAGHPDL
jgi:transposase-like protein